MIRWKNPYHLLRSYFHKKKFKLVVTTKSLFYNHHLNSSYLADILLEPVIWLVDNFSHALGKFFVTAVILLTTTVVFICFAIGFPYWWHLSWKITICLLIVGHWILINVIFHYFMGCVVDPGYPPQGVFIPEAASMCKKCIAPKPPRTHHCSVCDKCVLKMDHHCPWLNNCVGFRNHHHFFLYMAYVTLGMVFIAVFGVELFLEKVWWVEEELEGQSVSFNTLETDTTHTTDPHLWERRALVFMAFICVGVFIALGSLSVWHYRLISRGETSIEVHINKTEMKRYQSLGLVYTNPYDFGWHRNWAAFFGVEDLNRWQALRRILFPAFHTVRGNGLTWPTTR